MDNKTHIFNNNMYPYTTQNSNGQKIPQNLGALSMMDRYTLKNYMTKNPYMINDMKNLMKKNTIN